MRLLYHDLIRFSENYDFSTNITTNLKLLVTSQSKCKIIHQEDRIGDPRNLISQKYSSQTAFELCITIANYNLI